MKIYIVILHYKSIADTRNCMNSLAKIKDINFKVEVIIINNDRSNILDNLYKSMSKKIKNLKIVDTYKNLGYAGGINKGLKIALQDRFCSHILILNNDVILPADLLTKLLSIKADITGPVVKFQSLEKIWIYDYGGQISWWTGRTRHFESTQPFDKQFMSKKIDYVSGSCMLITRQVLEKIGIFDERFFFYFEDVDFCVRAKQAGFEIKVSMDVCAFHKLSGSIGRWSNEAIRNNLISNMKFINKHFTGVRKITGFMYLTLFSGKIIMDKLWMKK